MNTFDLSDELLARALRVDAEPLPGGLAQDVSSAVVNARRPSRWNPRAWIYVGSAPRPALSRALQFAALTALMVTALAGGLLYVGSRLPPAVTPVPMVTPVPIATPGATTTPGPVATERDVVPSTAPDALEISQDEFAAHVDASIKSFRPLAYSYTLWANSNAFDGFREPRSIREEWIPAEQAWISTHRPVACLAPGFNAWVDATNLLWNPAPPGARAISTTEGRAQWDAARTAIDRFDLEAALTCRPLPTPSPTPLTRHQLPTAGPEVPPTEFADFSAHLRESLARFSTQAPAWYLFATSLDGYTESRPFIEEWLPTERDWISTHRPDQCYGSRFAQWVIAVEDVIAAMTQVGGEEAFSSNPDFPAIWAPAFNAVVDFDPAVGAACPVPVSYAEFAAHVAEAKTAFTPLADTYSAFIHYPLDLPDYPRTLSSRWRAPESVWVSSHTSEDCFADTYDRWREAVNSIGSAGGHSLGDLVFGVPTEQRQAIYDEWADARASIDEFDVADGARCGLLMSFNEWTTHVDAVLAEFIPLSEQRDQALQRAGPFDAFLFKPANWLPSEADWLEGQIPEVCFAGRFRTWSTLVGTFGSTYEAYRTDPYVEKGDALTSWNLTRRTIAAFDPRQPATC